MVSISIKQEFFQVLERLSDEQVSALLHVAKTMQPEAEPQESEIYPDSYTPEELLMMPIEERNRLVAAAFEAAQDEDFELFEAYSEEDFDD